MRTRLYCFTNFNLEFKYQSIINDGKARYIAYGSETCPTTDRVHHQGFIYFANAQRSVKKVANLLGKCHVEPCRGSLKDNQDYCAKATKGVLVEFGCAPKQGQRMNLDDMMAGVKAGVSEVKLAEENPALWCQYGRRLERYRAILQPKRTWKSEVFVFYGASGTGKTRRAWEQGGPEMDSVKVANGFLIGYSNAPTVLIDDFDPSSINRQLLLQMLDRYPCTVNIKNGQTQWNPRAIILTSNMHPLDWFSGPRDSEALMRRITRLVCFSGFGSFQVDLTPLEPDLAQKIGTEVP